MPGSGAPIVRATDRAAAARGVGRRRAPGRRCRRFRLLVPTAGRMVERRAGRGIPPSPWRCCRRARRRCPTRSGRRNRRARLRSPVAVQTIPSGFGVRPARGRRSRQAAARQEAIACGCPGPPGTALSATRRTSDVLPESPSNRPSRERQNAPLRSRAGPAARRGTPQPGCRRCVVLQSLGDCLCDHANRVLAQPVSNGTLMSGSDRLCRNIQTPATRA